MITWEFIKSVIHRRKITKKIIGLILIPYTICLDIIFCPIEIPCLIASLLIWCTNKDYFEL